MKAQRIKECNFENCGKPQYAKGLCAGHLRQFRLGQTLTPLRSRRAKWPVGLLCSFTGCTRAHYANKLCKSHCSQLYAGKSLSSVKKIRAKGEHPEITFDVVDCPVPSLKSKCHIFRGYTGKKDGYGQISFNGKSVKAHRYVWEQEVGEIPDGLLMDHRCRVRNCINVKHLRLVTPQVNATENIVGSAWQINKAKVFCKAGHAYDLENTGFLKNKPGRYCKKCRKLYWKKSWLKRRDKINAARRKKPK